MVNIGEHPNSQTTSVRDVHRAGFRPPNDAITRVYHYGSTDWTAWWCTWSNPQIPSLQISRETTKFSGTFMTVAPVCG